ncbi:hypothetical protein [Lacisediminihabitans sp. H27-G8]|uniref:hypothetical protein n=1 Tax=Lacisediminihabitans sp. H27-G8 TaxID=3111909 RepID=UPI0038FC0C2A
MLGAIGCWFEGEDQSWSGVGGGRHRFEPVSVDETFCLVRVAERQGYRRLNPQYCSATSFSGVITPGEEEGLFSPKLYSDDDL